MKLNAHFYPAQSASSQEPLVLLHGWASDSNCWQFLLPALSAERDVITLDLPGFGGSKSLLSEDPEDWLQLVLANLPERCMLAGWSLGGMLALQLAARYPERVTALVTIASNLKFISLRDRWRRAMPARTERGFYQNFCELPDKTLRGFCALEAQGEVDERGVLKKLRLLQKESAVNLCDGWACALQVLAELDNVDHFQVLQQPGLHLFGAGDTLVPSAACDDMRALNGQQQVVVLPDCGHAPHVSQPDTIASLWQVFEASL